MIGLYVLTAVNIKGGDIWQPSQFVVTVKYITDQLIHSSVYDKLRNITFHFTIVYGLNKDKERESLWEDLGLIRNGVTSAWMVCGDFNSLMHLDERVGGTTVSWNEVMPMRDMVAKCDLVELKTMGAFFTWNNKHEHSSKVYSKIDRVLIDDTWLQQFPDCFAHFLPEGLFDHCPCLIQFHTEEGRKGVPFKYFNMWSMLDSFKQMVSDHWDMAIQGTPMFQMIRKLKLLKPKLKMLNKENFSDIENITQVTELSLQEFQKKLRTDPLNEGLCASEAACAKELVFLKKARAQYLLQKSKEQWMEEGDENTAFYHNRSSKPVTPINHGIVRKGACLTKENQKLLLQPVTDEEVRAAMFSIPGTKAPGPDGYISQFFKDTWAIVGKDVIKAVRSVFTSEKLLKECNATILTLIPKVEVPEAVHQFRPIACCNTIYKCVAKVLCTRLSNILPEIISPSQSAFTKGRDIVGNIFICQDLIKFYNRTACSPRVMMKIDLQKAYDSVEWAFLHEMLEALNFPPSIIAILMQCVSTPTYSIALNGNIFGYFKGRKGLRQGDPLSPLLFTICLEYLSRILAWVQQQNEFRFHPLCKRVQLSHLCFADDLIMFCRGDLPSVVLLLRAFKTFSKASGLSMNQGKSNIYRNGVDNSTMARLIRRSGMQRGTVPFRYLGVTITPKRLGVNDCQHLIEKFLWHGTDMKEGPALVAWDSICKSKRKGGLGLRSLYWWNIAAVAKYAWWIAKKTDHLWVRWVHAVYMKDKAWEDYLPGQGTSWSWRKICWTKDLVKQHLFSVDDYSIKLGYSWLVEEGPDKEWHQWFPNSIMVPRHSFILCEESLEHLFFKCDFSKRCIHILNSWLQFGVPESKFILWWINWRHKSLMVKKVLAAIVAAVVYQIWVCRNQSRLEQCVVSPTVAMRRVKEEIKLRIRCNRVYSKSKSACRWIEQLCVVLQHTEEKPKVRVDRRSRASIQRAETLPQQFTTAVKTGTRRTTVPLPGRHRVAVRAVLVREQEKEQRPNAKSDKLESRQSWDSPPQFHTMTQQVVYCERCGAAGHNAVICLAENDEVYAFKQRRQARHSFAHVPPHPFQQQGYQKPPFIWPSQQQTPLPVKNNEEIAELKSLVKALVLQVQ
ncbi:uncharacterized protein LOC141617144 [Silene latifolia]|uniref:uncharacterized protein LOC141617144 n=1 Tax=Silene latifolia TaxID=37657 RepID=UPI003D772D58